MVVNQRKQIRLKKYDYSDNGWYFVTICTEDRQEFFGNIVNNKMNLNEYGKIVKHCWLGIPKYFNNVELDEYIIMPNHVHGIIIIVGVSFMKPNQLKPEIKMAISKSNHHMGLINQTPTLGLIIRYFKSKCTYEIHKYYFNYDVWQRNYYEHIIRNEYSLFIIRQYIRNNSTNWNEDRNNISKGGDINGCQN